MTDGYAPGWAADAVGMMTARSAPDRAEFALGMLSNGDRVIDVGCGPGTITAGLARAIGSTGRAIGVDAQLSQIQAATAAAPESAAFAVASAYALPLADQSVDMYFSHALYEHLSRPDKALAEARRVMRDGGILAVAASDWSRAEFSPRTDDVSEAMSGHYRLRREAGGDPFAGGQLAAWARAAGFIGITEHTRMRVDLGYRELAAYVATRLENRLDDPQLRNAYAAAIRWTQYDGVVVQCWTEIVAHSSMRTDI